MSRFLLVLVFFAVLSGGTLAQDLGGLARVNPDGSRIADQGRDGIRIDLALSQGVPYRLFTLDSPPRLVLDFQEVDWTGLFPKRLVETDSVLEVQFGTYVPGWSRLVAELAEPMGVDKAGLVLDDVTGNAQLTVTLSPIPAEEFAARAGPPHDRRWDLPAAVDMPAAPARDDTTALVVVIDPGHGGIDPGAEVEGMNEKSLTLSFARELREALVRDGGFDVVLTRDDDYFVSLERRIALAHQAGADVFISLHADALSEGLAHGATVHVLALEASDVASAKLAERHDRDEILAGVDLSGADDRVTDILLDLARQETRPRTESLALALVDGMAQTGGPMNRRPLRSAAFSVLKAADIPSVLIEIGFMSSPRDLKNLQNPEWRAGLARGIRNGLVAWRREDAAHKAQVRQ